jgi:hypothetical protein
MILLNLPTRAYLLSTPVKLDSCRYTHIKLKMSSPELVLCGASVEAVEAVINCRLLGVTIINAMNWLPQSEKFANKLRSITYSCFPYYVTVSESSLKLIYFAYVQSQIMYSIVIWAALPHMQKVFVAQKRVVRSLDALRYWRSNCALDSCKPLFQKHGNLNCLFFI